MKLLKIQPNLWKSQVWQLLSLLNSTQPYDLSTIIMTRKGASGQMLQVNCLKIKLHIKSMYLYLAYYEKLKPLKSGFIENLFFENKRHPCSMDLDPIDHIG